jgi:hypothetical protein
MEAMMIWAKTEAGRVEMQQRVLVKERVQRNLLLLVDGIKTDELLLGSITGVQEGDLQALAALGLIAPVGESAGMSPSPAPSAIPQKASAAVPPAALEATGYADFTATLTRLISDELGLRGFTLTLAVEKAGTNAELREVAERVLEQIAKRRGPDKADKARRSLYGE